MQRQLLCRAATRAFVSGCHCLIPCCLCHDCLIVASCIVMNNGRLGIMMDGSIYGIVMYSTIDCIMVSRADLQPFIMPARPTALMHMYINILIWIEELMTTCIANADPSIHWLIICF